MRLIKNVQKGKQGEDIAKKYLQSLGYKIITTNWHYSKKAEIDIVAEDNDILVFVEVKARSTLFFGHPFEAITQTKINKIRSAILSFLTKCEKKYTSYRLDCIAITDFENPKIEHVKDVGSC